jgi:hypothetical protein
MREIVRTGTKAQKQGLGQLPAYWNAVIGGTPSIQDAFYEVAPPPIAGVTTFVREFSSGSEGVMVCVVLKSSTRVVLALVAFGPGGQYSSYSDAQAEALKRAHPRARDI